MGIEREKRPTPSRSEWKNYPAIALLFATSLLAGTGAGVAAFHGLLDQEPASRQEFQALRLVPTYTPTPKIEITPTPEPAATPIPEKISQETSDYQAFWDQIQAPKTEIIPPEQLAERREAEEHEIQSREKILIFRDLSQQYPEVWQKLPSRVEKVIAFIEKVNQTGPDSSGQKAIPIKLSNLSAYLDYSIFEKYGLGESNLSLTKENLLFVLAQYELEYAQPIEQNPNFQRALNELAPAIRVVNEIINDKLSPEEFVDQKTPRIPENLQRRLLFSDYNGGGHFIAEIDVIEEMKDSNPEKYQHLLEYLAVVVPHELIHAWPQTLSVGRSSWAHEKDYGIKKGDTLWDISQKYGLKVIDILEKNPQIENPDLIFPEQIIKIPQKGELIWPQNRKYHLAHMSMCSLTAPVQEKLGFEPGIEPRIVYIYSRLKEYGVEDPYGLIVQTGATMNSNKLWKIYEKVRGPEDLSLDKLISTNDPDPDFDYYTPEEFEAFRAEYASYLSPSLTDWQPDTF